MTLNATNQGHNQHSPEELKACPFCGGAGRLMRGEKYWRAYCEGSPCPTDPMTVGHLTEAEAAAAWNTRTPSPAVGEEQAKAQLATARPPKGQAPTFYGRLRELVAAQRYREALDLMRSPVGEEPTQRGDEIAAEMRAYYEANKRKKYVEGNADNLMLGLLNIAWRYRPAVGEELVEALRKCAAMIRHAVGADVFVDPEHTLRLVDVEALLAKHGGGQ